MALISWLKREGFGTYGTLDEFVGELARRSTSALGGLGAALVSAPANDLTEVAQGQGQGICTDVVRDLRVPKGARLAALKAVLVAGAGAQAPRLFAGASDLVADARLSAADREYLVRSGLKGLLDTIPPEALNVELLRGAHAASEAARAGAEAVLKELVDGYPANHASILTIRHAALGEPLPPELEARWLDLLTRQCRAARNAPPAAKRLGTAPEWPPMVPESFRPLLKRAEDAAAATRPTVGAVSPPTSSPVVNQPPATNAPTRSGAPSSVGKPVTPGSPPPARVQPPLRTRTAQGAAPAAEDEFRADGVQVDPQMLRSAPRTRVPPPGGVPLLRLRFGEQIDLVARRGTRAVERLMASYDVRAGTVGQEIALRELERAAEKRGADEVNGPILDELHALAQADVTPQSWKRAARAVLTHLGPDRAAALE